MPHRTHNPTQQTMAAVERETEILGRALEALRKTTGLTVTVEQREQRYRDIWIDAHVRIKAKGAKKVLPVEIKRHLTTQTLGVALAQLERLPGKGMLIADYVNPNLAGRLRERDIPFADTAGNAYLNFPPVLIYVAGNRAAEPAGKPAQTRAFQPAGLRIVFALLCKPDLAGAPYRDIARTTGAALGTVGWVLNDLNALGYLIEMGKRGRRLVNREKLLHRWAAAYPEQLRPQHYKGRFAGPKPDWWRGAKLTLNAAWWGGEAAAAKDTGYLKPARVAVYIRGQTGEFLARNGLRKDPEGETEVLEAFWDPMLDTGGEMAPPLIAYADLLIGDDPRNLEMAKIIYDRHLAQLVRKD